MAGEVKMLPPSVTVLWVPDPPGIEDVNAPTEAELVFDPQGSPAYNITCAIASDGFTAQFTDRDTQDERSLCDSASSPVPITKNFEVNLTFFRDAVAANNESVYNIAYDLFRKPLQPGYIVTRVWDSKKSTDPFVDGDQVQVFKVLSGDPQNLMNEGESIKMQVTFYAQGVSSDGYATVGGEVS